MLLNVNAIKNKIGDSLSKEFAFPMDPEILPAEVKTKADATGKVTATNIGQGILTIGTFKLPIEVMCSCCLEPFVLEVESNFVQEFRAEEHISVLPEEDEDVDYLVYKGEQIDLGELIIHYLALAVPMKPVCREECQGLCQICGQNKNLKACDCRTESVDPRLEVLKKLLNK